MRIFGRWARAGAVIPRAKQSIAPVDVTPRERNHGVTAVPAVYPFDRPLDPDLSGCDVAHVRAHLPNAPKPGPCANLQLARAAKVLDDEREFLVDTSGKAEPPDRAALIDALQLAADYLRDRIVIGSPA